ncbi:MAG: DUF6515 family protein [Syntrophales bacterium]|jgi:hypothetical protein
MTNIRSIMRRIAFLTILVFLSGIVLFAYPEEIGAQRQVSPGGSYGGYHGWYGGYHGWHGGYHGWYYGGWWYPWAPIVAFLPFYYTTVVIGGYPYYYADGYYYAPVEGGYMIVNPPQGAVNQVPPSAPPAEQLFIYPRKGQSEKQQADDRYQCHRWAVGQTGYDPTQPTGGAPAVQKRADYQRAMSACLDARGYTAR